MPAPEDPHPRALVRAAVTTLLLATVGGCTTVFDGAETCVSWVDFATPADAWVRADLVVVGRVVADAGSERVYGTSARVHRVEVDRVLSGDPPAREMDVVSVPVTCETGGPYPNGDPLDVDDPVVVFLHHDQDADRWWTLTPRHGVVPATADGDVPAAWSG